MRFQKFWLNCGHFKKTMIKKSLLYCLNNYRYTLIELMLVLAIASFVLLLGQGPLLDIKRITSRSSKK